MGEVSDLERERGKEGSEGGWRGICVCFQYLEGQSNNDSLLTRFVV